MNSGSDQPRVIVVGGSLGGLTAALVLRDAGCCVHVYERSGAALQGRGAGIVAHPTTVRYFTENRVLKIEHLSAPARWLRYLDRDSSTAYQEPCRYRFTSWNTLYRGLLGCFDPDRYHMGEEVVGFDQDAAAVTVHLVGGRRDSGDLLVCADGISSTARRILLPEVAPRYAGYVAWRGTVEEPDLRPATLAALHEAITYHLMPDSHIHAYPIPNADGSLEPGGRCINWVWYRNLGEGADLDGLMTDRAGVPRTVSLVPGSVQDRYARQLREIAAILPAPLADVVVTTGQPFIQVISDIEVPRMAFGRICLIGDAAFTVRPHAGAGTAKAAADAWKLADAVRAFGGDVVAALERWEPAQLALGSQLVARARAIGNRSQLLGTWQPGDPGLRFGLYRPGDSVIPESDANPAPC